MDTSYNRDEIKRYLAESLKGYSKQEIKKLRDDGDLHNEIFNTDFYLAYESDAIEFLGNNTFDIIRTVQDYETDNFGEITTDISDPVKLVNMYVYIVGEELVYGND